MIKKTYLKKSPKVSRLGFGAWPLGNKAHGKIMTEEEGIALVKAAYQAGVNFFDTAPNYSNGKSEIILGEALKNIRHNVVINSKFGHHPDGNIDFNENRIRASVFGSLERLQTNYLDSLILHNPSLDILQGKTSHLNELQQLKDEGVIRGFGVSIDTPNELETMLKHIKVDVIELLFNIFSQANRSYFEQIKDRNIALIIKVPLDSGWLTGKYTKNSIFTDIRSRWTKENKLRRHKLIEQLNTIIGEDLTPKYALGYIWQYDAVTTVIPGIRNEIQLQDHLASTKWTFPIELKKKFEKFYDERIADTPLPW